MPGKRATIHSNHPLVGTWTQEENPFDVTTVVYTIAVKEGRLLVSGVDESDGVSLKVSNVRWDGKQLRFVTYFPPTKHKAKHAFRVTGKGRVNHSVTYTDKDGTFADEERWIKRPAGRKRSARGQKSKLIR